MSLIVATPPVFEPIDIDYVKCWTRIDQDADDVVLNSLILAAREYVEKFTRRALITQTLEERFDCFPGNCFELRRSPVQSVTSIEYFDINDVEQTVSATTVYETDLNSEPARIALREGGVWPTVDSRLDPVKVTYVAGYATPEEVPESIRLAMAMLVDHWYEHRSPVTELKLAQTPISVRALLAQNRVY